MKIAVFAAVACIVMLDGCVSQSATLTNPEGKQVHCDNWGFGIIGAPASMAMHADCMKKARAAGYSEMPVSNPSPPAK